MSSDKYLNNTGLAHYDAKIKAEIAKKQDTLVSGTNIKKLENIDLLGSGTINVKTINNESVLGSGNINTARILYDSEYQTSTIDDQKSKVSIQTRKVDNNTLNIEETAPDSRGSIQTIYNMNLPTKGYVDTQVGTKQDTLVSGTNVKTINNESILGNGNISIHDGSANVTYTETSNKISNITDTNTNVNVEMKTPATGVNTNFLTVTCNENGTQKWQHKLPNSSQVQYMIETSTATEDTAGTIKLNPAQSINKDANGKLTVGGRMGQFEGTTGLFAPNDREPRAVGDYSLLITDAKGMEVANRAFAVVSGYGLACKSAPAGTTQYRITNNYANRIVAKMCENGYASRDEATSKAEKIVPVVSVQINNSTFTPDSSGNSSNDIIITTAETLNPDSAITNIRLFGKMQSYATIHTGNGIASWGGGRNLVLGGAVTKAGSSNDNCLVGMSIYSSGNGNACFGRQHIAVKNRGFFAGTGHDSTNAPSEGASAVGQYSYMDNNTLFAVGNGSAHTARSNAFEVRTDGIVLKSPNGTRYKISVNDSGNLTTTAL